MNNLDDIFLSISERYGDFALTLIACAFICSMVLFIVWICVVTSGLALYPMCLAGLYLPFYFYSQTKKEQK